jgi:hypothetical protein
MAKKLINKVPDILKARGLGFEELRWGAKMALNTAKRWADYDEAQAIDRIDVDTLVGVAEYLNIDDMNEILELVEKE